MSEETWPNKNQIPAPDWMAIRYILSQGKQSDRIVVRWDCLPTGFGFRMPLGTVEWPLPIDLNYPKIKCFDSNAELERCIK